MRKYRVSRFKQLIFPQELIIDKYHVLSRKRHFPAFWRVTEESIPLSKLASIQVHRGLFFSKLIVENSGGPYPIIVDGLWNRTAGEARDLLEMIEREIQKREDVAGLVGDAEGQSPGPLPGGRGPEPQMHSPPPPPPAENVSPQVVSDYHPDNVGDKADLQQVARDIVDEEPGASTRHVSPMAAHFESLQAVKDSIEPPSTPTPTIAETPNQTQSSGGRRFGEIPDNWNPDPPWKPKRIDQPIKPEEHGFREVDPVEFLNGQLEHHVALAQEQKTPAKPSGTAKLVDWWKTTTNEIKTNISRSRRRRRPLR